jgi:glutaredoxin
MKKYSKGSRRPRKPSRKPSKGSRKPSRKPSKGSRKPSRKPSSRRNSNGSRGSRKPSRKASKGSRRPRKGSKGSRRPRKGSRRPRKGSRRASSGSRKNSRVSSRARFGFSHEKDTWVLYELTGCGACHRAIERLKKAGVSLQVRDSEEHPQKVSLNGKPHNTWPKIYKNGVFIGGSDMLDEHMK